MLSKFFKNPMFVLLVLIYTLTLRLDITDASDSNEVDEITYPFRILQISDTQPVLSDEVQYQRVTKSIELVNFLQPDIVIFPGDITHSGTEEEYKRIKGILSTIEAPVYYVPGNHDTIWPANDDEKKLIQAQLREKKIPVYRKYFGSDYWSLEYGNFLFVGLDSTEVFPDIPPHRRQWLLKTLLSSNKSYKFIVTHYTHPQTYETALEHLMTSGGVVGYMQGHNHTVEAYNDVKTGRLVFSSGSASQIESYGVMYFDVYEDSIDCFWKPVNGEVKALGKFNLKEAMSAIAHRKDVFDIVPYIQELEPDSVTVKWQTKAESDAAVVYRDYRQKQWSKETLPEAELREIRLSKLTLGTKYEFCVDVNTIEFGQVKSP